MADPKFNRFQCETMLVTALITCFLFWAVQNAYAQQQITLGIECPCWVGSEAYDEGRTQYIDIDIENICSFNYNENANKLRIAINHCSSEIDEEFDIDYVEMKETVPIIVNVFTNNPTQSSTEGRNFDDEFVTGGYGEVLVEKELTCTGKAVIDGEIPVCGDVKFKGTVAAHGSVTLKANFKPDSWTV